MLPAAPGSPGAEIDSPGLPAPKAAQAAAQGRPVLRAVQTQPQPGASSVPAHRTGARGGAPLLILSSHSPATAAHRSLAFNKWSWSAVLPRGEASRRVSLLKTQLLQGR